MVSAAFSMWWRKRMSYYREYVETERGIPAKIYYGGSGMDRLRYPMHWHSHLEFDLVLEGCICGKAGSREIRAEAGEIFFSNSGELHETDATASPVMRSITVLLSDQLLTEYGADLERDCFVFEKGSSQEKELADIIRKTARAYQKKEDYYELEISVLLRQMCLILLRECRMEKEDTAIRGVEYKNVKKVKKAITYMEEHYDTPITVSQMGDVMSMTPAYFSRFFKNSTGETFHRHLTRIRLNQARTMLEQTEAGMTEVAFACGFPNIKSFIEAFKKEFGCTPAKYKKDKK